MNIYWKIAIGLGCFWSGVDALLVAGELIPAWTIPVVFLAAMGGTLIFFGWFVGSGRERIT